MKGIGTITLTCLRKDLEKEFTLKYWKTKHGWLVSQNDGCLLYRQVKFTDSPIIKIKSWNIKQDFENYKMPDGLAENLVISYINGAKLLLSENKKKIYLDERNFISDCFMYQTTKKNTIYYKEELKSYNNETGLAEGQRLFIMFKSKRFKNSFLKKLSDLCMQDKNIKEIHSYNFMKYNKNIWKSKDVNHRQPHEDEYKAALMLGAIHKEDILKLLNSKSFSEIINNSGCSVINIFDVEQVLIMRYDNNRSLAAIRGNT